MNKLSLRAIRARTVGGSRSASWVDGVHDDGMAGWVHFPLASPLNCQAFVNGEPARAQVHKDARPDVGVALGLAEPAHSFRIWFDVLSLPTAAPLSVQLRSGDLVVDIWSGSAGELVLQGLTAELEHGEASPQVAPSPQQASGAYSEHPAPPSPPDFFCEGEAPGLRADILLSRFQAHCYYRHVRDHPSFRTARHFTLESREAAAGFLVWSLRNYAHAHPFAPLPVGDADLELLNSLAPGTGAPKGVGLLTELPLTLGQSIYLQERYERLLVSDAEEMADWLLAWLGSWGWGHRGAVLLTAEQRQFMRGQDGTGLVADAYRLNRFANARLRENPDLRETYAQLQTPTDRARYLRNLAQSEWRHVGTTHFLRSEAERCYRPAPPSNAERPDVCVIGMLNSRSGLGQNARHSLAALRLERLSVAAHTISLNDRSADGLLDSDESSSPARVNLWHLNPDNVPEAVTAMHPAVYETSYNIGFFAWELDIQPRAHQLAIDWVDEIWVPSQYCADSFSTVTSKPVRVMPHALMVPPLTPARRSDFGIPEQAFVVHFAFDMHSWPQRKNPLAVIRAFQAAYDDDDVRLLLKIRNGQNIGLVDSDLDGIGEAVMDLARQDARILIDLEERTYAETLAMLQMCDCHLSLHRSEGFGYGLAESLALGVPVIASDYGGSTEFCTPEVCWPVPTSERLLAEGEYYLAPPGARWGEPDHEAATAALRDVRRDPAATQRKVEAGKALARENFAIKRMAQLYRERLTELLPAAQNRH